MKVYKKMLLTLMCIGIVGAITACAVETGSTPDSSSESVTETADISTEGETTTEGTIAEEETTGEDGTVTEEETTAEDETDEQGIDDNGIVFGSGNPANQDTVMTNEEFVNKIVKAFGLTTDGTYEDGIQALKDWDVIDSDVSLNKEDTITGELLITAAIRATGFVDGTASIDDVIKCGVEKGILNEGTTVDSIDLTAASIIVDKAKYAWTHQDFGDQEVSVELQDGVIDLTDAINENGSTYPLTFKDGMISITTGLLGDIELKDGDIFIIPKEIYGDKGGAYRILKSNFDVPAGVYDLEVEPITNPAEVYKSVSTN